MAEIVYQDLSQPDSMLAAAARVVSPGIVRLRVASAYVTYPGTQKLLQQFSDDLGPAWAAVEKELITSFDFGHTDPAALRKMVADGFDLRVSSGNLGPTGEIRLLPAVSNFHPKIYIAEGTVNRMLVGSPNLSERAFSASVEAAVYLEGPEAESQVIANLWNKIVASSVVLTPAILTSYEQVRSKLVKRLKKMPVAPDAPLPPPVAVSLSALSTLEDAVNAGSVDPAAIDNFWVEAGTPSGGSRNQLELPRMGHRFFVSPFSGYGSTSVTAMGTPVLAEGGVTAARKLQWHGDNRMERLNLPPHGQSHYVQKHILFTRLAGEFGVTVVDSNGLVAEAWEKASESKDTLFRVGKRLCGFF